MRSWGQNSPVLGLTQNPHGNSSPRLGSLLVHHHVSVRQLRLVKLAILCLSLQAKTKEFNMI
jgi:hypothetical protein